MLYIIFQRFCSSYGLNNCSKLEKMNFYCFCVLLESLLLHFKKLLWRLEISHKIDKNCKIGPWNWFCPAFVRNLSTFYVLLLSLSPPDTNPAATTKPLSAKSTIPPLTSANSVLVLAKISPKLSPVHPKKRINNSTPLKVAQVSTNL